MQKSRVTFQDEMKRTESTVIVYHDVSLKKSDGKRVSTKFFLEITTIFLFFLHSRVTDRSILAQRSDNRFLFSIFGIKCVQTVIGQDSLRSAFRHAAFKNEPGFRYEETYGATESGKQKKIDFLRRQRQRVSESWGNTLEFAGVFTGRRNFLQLRFVARLEQKTSEENL